MPKFRCLSIVGYLLLSVAISPAQAASVANTPAGTVPTPVPLAAKGHQQAAPAHADKTAGLNGASLGALALPPATQFVP